jgi:hypothetical protein
MFIHKKSTLWILLISLISLLIVSAAPLGPGFTRLTVINRTGKKVLIHMTSEDGKIFKDEKFVKTYNFTAWKGTQSFIVEKHVYNSEIRGCGQKRTRNLDLLSQLRVTLPECGRDPKHGERTMLKIVLQK